MKINIKIVVAMTNLIMGMLVFEVSAAPMSYDFQPSSQTPVTGYTEVDEATSYSSGSGYGWLDTSNLFSRTRSGNSDGRLVDSVGGMKLDNHFRVDLVNGSYTVNVAGGDALFASSQGFRVSGDGGGTWIFIGRDSSNDDTDGITSGKALPYSFKYDGQTADWNRWPSQHDMFNVSPNEYLQGMEIPVTVSGGYLLISGATNQSSGSASYINFAEIVPVPEPASLAMMGAGGLLLLVRRRCW